MRKIINTVQSQLNTYDVCPVKLKNLWLIGHLREVIRMIFEGYAKKDLKIIENMHALKKEMIHEKFYPIIEKGKSKESIVIYHLASSVRLLYLANSPVTGLLLSSQELGIN